MPIHDAIRQRLQPLTASVTSNRIMFYALFSTCAMLGAIANACISQSNFYSVMIHLSRSGRSVLILANFGFLATLLVGRILQRIFFGPLQPREVERLYDQTWMFVTESLLAFTIFRDDFDVPFVLMFGFLLFVKCFHWLMADRIESMDQTNYPGPPVLFHIRMNTLFMTLSAVDFIMFTIAVDSTLTHGVGGMVLFATEYAILMASALNAMARYSLNNFDYRRAANRGGDNAPPWEHKSMYIFYIELVTDFLKLATYLTFFTIILTFYGLPLNIIRDVYLTARSFISRLRALIRYQNATRDMDRRYPNASEEELTAMSDRTCIICREELSITGAPTEPPAVAAGEADPPVPPQIHDGPNMTPKKLPCGHIFHFQCLRSWLERQQSCPTCRRTVLETDNPTRNGTPQQRQQRQQPNGGARPAPPQPGAIPQPFQPFQPQIPQQPQNQSHFLRFLRRALGLAAQPPLVPGQFPNQFGPQPFGPQMPPPYGYVPHGQPVPQGFYYVPYYPYPPPPPQPQQLHPAPIVRGFYGPGGVWHPWPVDQAQDQNPPPAPTLSAAQPQPHSQPPPAPGPVPVAASDSLPAGVASPDVPAASTVPRSPAPQSVSSLSSVSTTDEESSSESESDASRTPSGPATRSDTATPRDAAALAALRRLGMADASKRGSRTTSSGVGSTSGVSSSVEIRPAVSGRANLPMADLTTAPATDTMADTVQPTPTTTTTSPDPSPSALSSTTTANTRQRAPALLPLYDPTRPAGSQGVNYILPHQQYVPNPYYNPNMTPYGPGWRPAAGPARMSNGNPGNSFAQTRPAPYPTSSTQLHSHSHQHQHQPRSSGSTSSRNFRPNLSTLPSTLTDEQLSRLDRVTRDAIDERLRVLEGVSSAVHRCIEELTRVRSVLPPGSVGSALSGAPMGQGIPARVAVAAATPSTPAPVAGSATNPAAVVEPSGEAQPSSSAPFMAIVDGLSSGEGSSSTTTRDDHHIGHWAKVQLPVDGAVTPSVGSAGSDTSPSSGDDGSPHSRSEEKKKASSEDLE